MYVSCSKIVQGKINIYGEWEVERVDMHNDTEILTTGESRLSGIWVLLLFFQLLKFENIPIVSF